MLHTKLSWLKALCFLKILIIFKEGGRKGERERETSISCLSHASNWRPDLQPKHAPWLRIKPVIFWFAEWHPIPRTTPVRADWRHFSDCLETQWEEQTKGCQRDTRKLLDVREIIHCLDHGDIFMGVYTHETHQIIHSSMYSLWCSVP